MKAAKTSTTASVFGASRNTQHGDARAPRRPATAATSCASGRPPSPCAKLPTMLNRPTIASAQAPTDGGSWQAATTPGRWVAMKATWKPQTKKPAREQQVARVAHRAADRLARRLGARGAAPARPRRARRRLRRAAAQQPRRRQREQRRSPPCSASRSPSRRRAVMPCGDRHEHELAERAAGVDDAGGDAALLRRRQPRGRRQQHRRPGEAGAAGGEHADRDDQAERRRHQRHERGAERDQQQAEQQHAAGAVAVGDDAGDRLRQAPPQLADAEREADARQAEAGGRVDDARGTGPSTGARPSSPRRCRRRRAGPGRRRRGACARRGRGGFSHRRSPARWSTSVARHSSSSACSSATRADAEPLVERELGALPLALRLGALGTAGARSRSTQARAAVGAGADLGPAVGDQRLQVAGQRRRVHRHRGGEVARPDRAEVRDRARAASTASSSGPTPPTIAVIVLADAARQLAQLEVGAAAWARRRAAAWCRCIDMQ